MLQDVKDRLTTLQELLAVMLWILIAIVLRSSVLH